MPQYQQKTKFPILIKTENIFFKPNLVEIELLGNGYERNLGKISMGTHLNRPQMLIKN